MTGNKRCSKNKTVSRMVVSEKDRVWSQAIPCGLCGWQSWHWKSLFFSVYFGIPFSLNFHWCSITLRGQQGWKTWEPPQKQMFFRKSESIRSKSILNVKIRHYILTCICLRSRLFRVTLKISGTVPWYCDVTAETLTATHTYALRMRMCERG
jgi:hypothetical protein